MARARGLRRRLLAGVTLMTLLTAGFALAPATAQEAEEQELEVTESALYATPPTEVIPRTLTSDFPPTAICVVIPEICPPELDPIRDPVRSGLGEARRSGQASPVQPVPPDTVAVSYLGGTTRYQSAIKFELPPPPAGEEYTSFQVILPQTQPSYDIDSPAFRRIVLGVFAALGPQDPGIFIEGVADALQNHDPIDLSDKIGIEACAFTQPFEPGGAPQAHQANDLPRDEETQSPALDCNVGTNGQYDAATGEWTFDLTFAAQDWTAGALQNHGILLRPSGGHNLAFGDPDLSNNSQIILDITAVRVAMETAEPPPPVGGLEGGFDFEESGGETVEFGGGGFDGGFEGGFGEAPMMGTDVGGFADEPAVAEDDLAAPGEAPMAAEPELEAMTPARDGPGNPWWMWLLIPVFMLGTYVTAQALTATPAAATAAAQRPGAMSRLIARRNGGAPLSQA